MMVVMGVAQYLVSGKINTPVMVAVSVPLGMMLARSCARKKTP